MDLSNLNEPQKNAVLHNEGPMMILAGAGSGKTRTLVTKIQYLLTELKIPSFHILAMTFSNKAAKEMQERIRAYTGEQFGNLFLTTFHSFCARILRTEATYIGLSRNFTIYDDSEMLSVIKAIMSRRGLSQKEINPTEIKYYINSLKNVGYFKDCEDYKVFDDSWEVIDKDDLYFDIFEEYERELHTSNAVDFGGLIVGVVELFAKHPKILERYQKRFKYLLIDEYQDTNRAQFLLLKHLSGPTGNICVVGDEDQSIYSWRGADIHNILDFEDYFEDVEVVKLEQNYRSSKNIIEAASYVINQNTQRKGKNLWTENPDGEAIEIIECIDDTTEANYVTEKVLNLQAQGVSLGDMAIFYRNNSQSRVIEDALRKRGVPYKIIGGIKFYDRKEVKDALSYLKVINNSKDSLSLSRVINSPTRGIGAVTLRKIETEAIKLGVSLYEMMLKIQTNLDEYKHLRLSGKVKSAIKEFVSTIEEVKRMDSNGETPSYCLEKLLEESGYLLNLRSVKSYENLARIDNLKELINAVKQFEVQAEQASEDISIGSFLETVTLDQNVEGEDEFTDLLPMMTVHGSKGLEYDHVFVVGVEENLFPSIMSLEEGEDRLEEERRLFYVAMTRAMEKLRLTFCKSRLLWGRVQFHEPSRFLTEIPEHFVQWQFIGKKGKRSAQPVKKTPVGVHFDDSDDFNQETENYFDASSSVVYNSSHTMDEYSDYSEGLAVKHGLYGEGTIVKREGYGADEKVTIRFREGSTKKFLLKYAPIEILG